MIMYVYMYDYDDISKKLRFFTFGLHLVHIVRL